VGGRARKDLAASHEVVSSLVVPEASQEVG
jgi:hypothetical protein